MVQQLRDLPAPVAAASRHEWDKAVHETLKRESEYSWWLDSFQNDAGTLTQRQMLEAAWTDAAAQDQPPVIKLGPKFYDFSKSASTGLNGFPGAALAGPRNQGIGTVEQGVKGAACRARFNGGNGTQSMFYINGGGAGASIYSPIVCHDIAWESTNNVSQWLHAPFSAVNMYGPIFGNLEFTGFYRCIGAPGDAATITLCVLYGQWNIPNMSGTPMSFRGSDNWLVPDEANVGWNAGPTGEYLFRAENMQKTWIRGFYWTCRQGGTRALLVDNGASTTQGSLFVKDCVIEGQNLDEPAGGALVYVNGNGVVNLSECAVNFAMGNPTPFSPDDTAMIIANLGTHGLLNVHDLNITRATGVGQNVPVIDHQGTGRVNAHDIFGMPGNASTGSDQGWTDLPAVKKTGTGFTRIDDTLRYLSGLTGINSQSGSFVKQGAFAADDYAGYPYGCRVGSLGRDITNGKLYICTATNGSTTATWSVVGAQS